MSADAQFDDGGVIATLTWGNYSQARGYARQALELNPEAGEPTSLAIAWSVLGLAHTHLGGTPRPSAPTARPWPSRAS